ncbi:MAG: DUF3343 domain-containing protein [Proteocatella sp.]
MSSKLPNRYLVTFFTHSGAIKYRRMLEKQGITCETMPVPRSLSSSCGICVKFVRSEIKDIVSTDVQAIYLNSDACVYENIFTSD